MGAIGAGVSRWERLLRALVPVLAPCLLLSVVALPIAAFGAAPLQNVAVGALINVIVLVGMYVFVGNSGIYSFGHISFMAIGAYVAALITIPPAMKRVFFLNFPHALGFVMRMEANPWLAAVVAGSFAAVFALVIGVALMRLHAFPASVATLSLLIIVNTVIANWDAVTHGTSLLVGAPNVATVKTTLVVALIAVIVAYVYQVSGRGLLLRASREDQYAAQMVGINIVLERWIAFGISAFIVGVAGAMYAFWIPFYAPNFYLQLTFYTVAILIIGGRNSLWGAVLGTVAVSSIAEAVREVEAGITVGGMSLTGMTEVVVALAMLLILILRPDGITRGREVTWPLPFLRSRNQRAAGPAVRQLEPESTVASGADMKEGSARPAGSE